MQFLPGRAVSAALDLQSAITENALLANRKLKEKNHEVAPNSVGGH
jgi:hypothetical protein